MIATLLLLYIRMPDRILNGYLWAEDAIVFMHQAYRSGFKSIVYPAAGYVQIVPRFIAYVASLIFPVTESPHVFVWICVVVTIINSVWIYLIARRILPEAGAILAALAPILVPGSGEVWLNVTNLQWLLSLLLIALIWEEFWSDAPHSRLRPIAISTLGLTGPYIVFFTPVLIAGIVKRRRGHAYLILPCLQLVAVVISRIISARRGVRSTNYLHPVSDYLHYPWLDQALHHLVFDFFAPQTVGDWHIIAIACAVTILALVLFAGRLRPHCLTLLALGLALWASGLMRVGAWDGDLAWFASGSRYFFIPSVFLAWCLIAVTCTSTFFRARVAASVLLTMMLVVSAANFRPPPITSAIFTKISGGWIVEVPPGGCFWMQFVADRNGA